MTSPETDRSRAPSVPAPLVSSSAGRQPAEAIAFDGQQALRYLQSLCELGPRISGTSAMARQQELLRKHFETLGASVELQRFPIRQPSRRGRVVEGANLIARWHRDAKRRVLLGAHYDTRPIADQEPLVRNQKKPILGANDSASGTAFLMELGRVIDSVMPTVGVDFVFFDAEEYIYEKDRDKYFLGSEHFVTQLMADNGASRYRDVVVLDMIADKQLRIHPEEHSIARGGALVREIWDIARELKIRQFRPDVKFSVLDDHIPFQNAGINAIVLIDFDYPHWHRLSDTPEQCSAESLGAVGQVIVAWLQRR